MTDFVSLAILISAGLIVASAVTAELSQRIGAPLLLVFLAVGLLAGEDGIVGLRFDDVQNAYFIGSLALAIILFDSGFATPLKRYKEAAAPALLLATAGVLITTGLVGAAASFLLGLGWIEALLLGAIIASTDAAAVFFLLKASGVTLRERVAATLEIESGTNDPMAVFLTVTLVGVAAAADGPADPGPYLVWVFVREIGLGGVLGWAGGVGIAWLLNRLRALDPGLHPIVAVSLALMVFGATGLLGGSGFLAAYVAGLTAGNRRILHSARIRRFQVGMTWLAQIGMFLTLGLLATPSDFGAVALPAVLLAAILIFVARPVAVAACLLPFGFKIREIAFVGWVGLRGAVSILLAILPTIAGLPDAALYFDIVFMMVVASLLVQGWTTGRVARWLRLAVRRRTGVVARMELELPGADKELVGYRVHPSSPAGRGDPVPRWARPVLVVRGERSFTIHNAGPPRAQDDVYLFASSRQVALLDRFYGPASRAGEDGLLGDFALAPDTRLAEVARLHGQRLEPKLAAATVSDFLLREFSGSPELGDRAAFGQVDLIVRGVDDDGAIVAVGLGLEPGKPAAGLRPRLAQLLRVARLRRRPGE